MIGRCSPDSQHGRPERHPANVGCSLFRYTNVVICNHNDQKPKRKTWTSEDHQLVLHCYFRSNPSQRGYRKRMTEIWQECARFQTTSKRLADQVRTIIKKGWFSELEILEIHQKINNEQDSNTVPDTSRIHKKSLTEMNRDLRKMKTLHNQTTHNQTTQNKHYHKNKRYI